MKRPLAALSLLAPLAGFGALGLTPETAAIVYGPCLSAPEKVKVADKEFLREFHITRGRANWLFFGTDGVCHAATYIRISEDAKRLGAFDAEGISTLLTLNGPKDDKAGTDLAAWVCVTPAKHPEVSLFTSKTGDRMALFNRELPMILAVRDLSFAELEAAASKSGKPLRSYGLPVSINILPPSGKPGQPRQELSPEVKASIREAIWNVATAAVQAHPEINTPKTAEPATAK